MVGGVCGARDAGVAGVPGVAGGALGLDGDGTGVRSPGASLAVTSGFAGPEVVVVLTALAACFGAAALDDCVDISAAFESALLSISIQ